jgi:hypothetical protein
MPKTAGWGQSYQVLLDTGLTQDAFTLDASTLNTGPDVLDGRTDFADVTEFVLSVSIRRGRATQIDTMSVGQCTIVLDDRASSRAFDPANTASPYVQSGYGISPRRFVQVYAGTANQEPLFAGRVNDLNIDYQMPNNSVAVVSAVDDLSAFGRTNLVAFTPTSQLTSARVSAILDRTEVSYSTATRNIATGAATCGTVAYDDNDNVKAAIDAVVHAEDGRFFISRGGTATFQSRIDYTFGTAIMTFSDAGGTAYPYQEVSIGYGAETLYNRVQVGVQGLAVSTAIDSASITEFGLNTLALGDLPLDTQAAGTTLASNLLDKYKNPVFRFDEISTLLNGMGSAAGEDVCQLEIGDLVAVTKTYTTGSPATVSETMYVENISHEITPSFHRVRLGLGQAALLTAFILNTSTLDDVTVALA